LLLNAAVKILVHRHRPFVTQWDGYSFPSGHTIGAILLYGTLLLILLPMIRGRHWKALAVVSGVLLMALVGFSRIALGAHYLTDVVGAMLLGGVWLSVCRGSFGFIHRRQMRLVPAPVPVHPQDDLIRTPGELSQLKAA
jgi:undecaprenyl-diphosphatase